VDVVDRVDVVDGVEAVNDVIFDPGKWVILKPILPMLGSNAASEIEKWRYQNCAGVIPEVSRSVPELRRSGIFALPSPSAIVI
jgi:hypothetical protein